MVFPNNIWRTICIWNSKYKFDKLKVIEFIFRIPNTNGSPNIIWKNHLKMYL